MPGALSKDAVQALQALHGAPVTLTSALGPLRESASTGPCAWDVLLGFQGVSHILGTEIPMQWCCRWDLGHKEILGALCTRAPGCCYHGSG